MHPFALNEKQVEQVSGGSYDFDLEIIYVRKPRDDWYTTMAIGEEGGAPPVELLY